MSEATKKALDEALDAHIQDESTGDETTLVTGYTLSASFVTAESMEGQRMRYFMEYSEDIAHHAAYGLSMQLVDSLKNHMETQWRESDDSDD